MNDRFIEIFSSDEDFGKWDKHIEHVDAIEEFNDLEKGRFKDALSYLRMPDVLGEEFITLARRLGHPLWSEFSGPGAWSGRWLVRFAAAMRDLRCAAGFSTCMKEQIKDAEKFTEREAVLEVAYKFFKAGFEVSFDPAATVFKPHGFTGRLLPSQTTPDLKIVVRENGEEIFVEVSALGKSDISQMSYRTYRAVYDVLVSYALHREYLFPRARVPRILDDDELKVLVGQLVELVEMVKSSNQVQYLINDEVEACLAPAHLREVPARWAAERGITSIPVEGPSIPLRDPLRFKRIVRKELRQLPKEKPGVVVITADWALLFHAHGAGAIVAELEGFLPDLPKLSCSVVTCAYSSGKEGGYVASEGPHTVIKRVTETGLTEETVISYNTMCAVPLSKTAAQMVRNAFAHC